jgi:hypothetical protein
MTIGMRCLVPGPGGAREATPSVRLGQDEG